MALEITLRIYNESLGITWWLILYPIWWFGWIIALKTPLITIFHIRTAPFLSVMFLLGPERTELQAYDGFIPEPLVTSGLSLLHCSLLLMSSCLQSWVLVALFYSEPWLVCKCCFLGQWFLQRTSFITWSGGPERPNALKWDLLIFLSIKGSYLLICGDLLSQRTFTKPIQYDVAWIIKIHGARISIT